MAHKIATFEQVKALKDDQSYLLIDVREPLELKETGILPGSINIPCMYYYCFYLLFLKSPVPYTFPPRVCFWIFHTFSSGWSGERVKDLAWGRIWKALWSSQAQVRFSAGVFLQIGRAKCQGCTNCSPTRLHKVIINPYLVQRLYYHKHIWVSLRAEDILVISVLPIGFYILSRLDVTRQWCYVLYFELNSFNANSNM